MEIPNKLLFTYQEVADILRSTYDGVRMAVKRGRLKAVTRFPGEKSKFIPRSEVLAVLSARTLAKTG